MTPKRIHATVGLPLTQHLETQQAITCKWTKCLVLSKGLAEVLKSPFGCEDLRGALSMMPALATAVGEYEAALRRYEELVAGSRNRHRGKQTKRNPARVVRGLVVGTPTPVRSKNRRRA